MKLPSLPEGFTVKFLGDLLQRPLRSVGIESVGEGTGMMADMSRLTLEFEDSTEPLCMIAKYSAQNPQTARWRSALIFTSERRVTTRSWITKPIYARQKYILLMLTALTC